MVAAGEGVVFVVAGVGPVVAGLVLVVLLVVPGPVVEISVFVGDLVAVQPVDGNAPVGAIVSGACVVPGVDGRGAADDGKAIAVGLYVGVAVCCSALNEVVVGVDAGRAGVVPGG